jgi:hypothetical protein
MIAELTAIAPGLATFAAMIFATLMIGSGRV